MSKTLETLFSAGRDLTLDQGDTLFRTDDDVRRVFFLNRGRIDLIRHSKSGDQITLHRAEPGQVLAEASAYSARYHCDGVAIAPSALRALPVAAFRAALDRDAALATAWAKTLASALQSARLDAEIRSLRTVRARLDAWLSGGRPLPDRGQLQTLATSLGISREALYRELSRRR